MSESPIPAATTEKTRSPDWERIEVDFRAGVFSIREIAKQHGITDTAIRKRAKAQGWERDLSAKIQARAEALVRKEAVREEVRANQKLTEQREIEIGARSVADVKLSHRSDIRRGRALLADLIAEVERQNAVAAELAALTARGEKTLTEPEIKRLAWLKKEFVTTEKRIASVKALAEATRVLVQLERQAWGILDSSDPPPPADGEGNVQNNDLARRLAFLLASGVQRAQQGA